MASVRCKQTEINLSAKGGDEAELLRHSLYRECSSQSHKNKKPDYILQAQEEAELGMRLNILLVQLVSRISIIIIKESK